jgi:hypothetical protein
VDRYGLFSVMTTRRPEIVIEGSADGTRWREYAFRWKPGDVKQRPAFVAPHMPRLDWQMWFQGLGDESAPDDWFVRFVRRLLEGSSAVLGLLAHDPFAGRPPRGVRVWVSFYRPASEAERARTAEHPERQDQQRRADPDPEAVEADGVAVPEPKTDGPFPKRRSAHARRPRAAARQKSLKRCREASLKKGSTVRQINGRLKNTRRCISTAKARCTVAPMTMAHGRSRLRENKMGAKASKARRVY